MRRYSIFKRKNQAVWYAQIKNPATGGYLPPKSTGQKDKSEALLVVADWLANGIPKGPTRTRRSTREALTIDTVLYTLRQEPLTQEDAKRIIDVLEGRGLIHGAKVSGDKGAEKLLPFLEAFWDWETSEYVRTRRAHKKPIGKRHCYEQGRRLKHWREHWGDATIADVDGPGLERFQTHLSEKGLADKTINEVVRAGTVALRWAVRQKIIDSDPTAAIEDIAGPATKRGILTTDEARALFAVPWPDPRGRVAAAISFTTGARLGEVQALRPSDVVAETVTLKDGTQRVRYRLIIRHSWSRADGLKSPKNGEPREVPLRPWVYREIKGLIAANPLRELWDRVATDPDMLDAGPWLFWGRTLTEPASPQFLRSQFYEALIDSKIPEPDRGDPGKRDAVARELKARNLTFHSFRHGFTTYLRQHVEDEVLSAATGHKTLEMVEHYANHRLSEAFDAVDDAAGKVFDNIVDFRSA